MERSSAASLNCLHTEILQMICNYLWQDYNPGPWEKQVPNKALAALTATSRRMRSIAMPVLYNHPTGAIPFGALIWILENRPEIRDYITYLELPDPLAWSSQHFEYLKGVARRLSMDIDGDEDFEKAKETEVSLKRFGAELLMALSPKVETMVLHIEAHGRDREDTSFSFLARRFKQLGAAAHFKHLRELSLTFGQCPDGYGIDNPGVATILGAAPHLKTLMFERTYGLREWYRRPGFSAEALAPAFRNLEVLDFHDSAFEDDMENSSFGLLQEMVIMAPKLRSFRFSFDLPYIGLTIDRHFTAARFLKALEPRYETLEVLDLDLTNVDMTDESGEPLIKRSDLVPFSRLHTLRLHDACFCLHRNKGQDTRTISDEPYHCVTRLLPSTVRVLSLRIRVAGIDDGRPSWGDVIYLGRRRAAGHFRNLEQVEVIAKYHHNGRQVRAQGPSMLKELEEAFEGSRVKVSLPLEAYFGSDDDEDDYYGDDTEDEDNNRIDNGDD